MRLEELYNKYDEIVGNKGLHVTPSDHFIFDLGDENSQKSLKATFPGIETTLMPEVGQYLVVAPIVEDGNTLVMMFPHQADGSAGLWAFNTDKKKSCNLMDYLSSQEGGTKPTIDNFIDFANMGEIANRFNEFTFAPGGETPTEVKDIGSFEVSNDEPVEITNPNTDDNEETKMAFKPITEEDELKETKWVEIPNTNAHGVTVTEDGEEQEDPFADGSLDANADPAADAGNAEGGDAAADAGNAAAPAEGGDQAAPAEGDAAPAEGGDAAAEAPADDGATIDDPKAKMRELLTYYTNYMTELVQDPNTSTDLISATQEMIDSLIKNMESADGIEEVKAETEEAAKEEVSAEETPAEGEGEAAPAEGDAAAAPEEAPVAESIKAKGIMGNISKFFGGGYETDDLSKATVDELAEYVFASFPRLTEYEISDLFNKTENGYGFNMTLFKNQYDKVIRPQLEEKGADPTKLDAIPNEVRDRQSGIFNKMVGFLNSLAVKQKKGVNEADEIIPIPVGEGDEQDASDAKIDSEIDDLHKDDLTDIEPIQGDDILTPGDIRNSAVNDVDLSDVPPTSDEELAATAPDMSAPAPTSDVLDDTELPSPDEEVSLLGTDDLDDYAIGADGLPVDKFEGDVDALATTPVSKKINWSTDYATNGMATTDDNSVVVPEVLKELEDYYKKVADEVSKVPGKEDVAMKLQKIQILSQTIANEWNGIVSQISDTCANSYDLSNMGDLEKDELASQDAMNMIGADVMADQEQDEEDDLAINADVAAFVESFKHLY